MIEKILPDNSKAVTGHVAKVSHKLPYSRGWAETKQFLFILKIYNNDKYPKQNQIGAKYVSTLYSTAKYQIKVF